METKRDLVLARPMKALVCGRSEDAPKMQSNRALRNWRRQFPPQLIL